MTSQTDRSKVTMENAIDCDLSLGSVHVMGAIVLVITGEGLHLWPIINTCMQGASSLVITIHCHTQH